MTHCVCTGHDIQDALQNLNYICSRIKPYREESRFKNLIICYSRPKNLRDSLMQTKLNEPEGQRISDLLLETN
jgi:hypothetical protein